MTIAMYLMSSRTSAKDIKDSFKIFILFLRVKTISAD